MDGGSNSCQLQFCIVPSRDLAYEHFHHQYRKKTFPRDSSLIMKTVHCDFFALADFVEGYTLQSNVSSRRKSMQFSISLI